jgi:hypothetical protein
MAGQPKKHSSGSISGNNTLKAIKKGIPEPEEHSP